MSWNQWDPTAPMGPSAPAPASPYTAPPWPAPHPAAQTTDESSGAPVRQRRWVAALTLYLLAPLVAEALTGSTPPLNFFTPLTLLLESALYGSGALLVRETARRRSLGWGSIVLLGAAYGVLEEGLVVTSWLNPYWPDVAFLHNYSRALGVNWFWALGLTAFHAIFSVTLPITLVEAAFPALAPLPWLRARGYHLLGVLLACISIVGLISFGFLEFHAQGYHPSPLGWLLALAIALALVWLGLHPHARPWRRSQGAIPPVISMRHAPSLPALRFAGFGFTLLYYAVFWGFGPHLLSNPLVGELALAATLAGAGWMVSRWSHRIDWSSRRQLALLSGVMIFFIALAPLQEFVVKSSGKDESGLTLLAVVALAGLLWLARSARLAEERRLR